MVRQAEERGGTRTSTILCPGYVRGEAYLALHDGEQAANEFQKFISHRAKAEYAQLH